MNIQPDFEDFLRLLEARNVDYMIVGGYAVAFHRFPRFTKDIDSFFEMDLGEPKHKDRQTGQSRKCQRQATRDRSQHDKHYGRHAARQLVDL